MLRSSRLRQLPASGIFLVAMLLACFAFATQALAHAALTGTNPKDGEIVANAPALLSLSFSEAVSPLTLSLIRPDGSSVPLKDFVLRDRTVEIDAPSDLANGTHVLTWRVVSEDGHPVGGSVIFSIGEPSASQPVVPEAGDFTVRSGVWITKVLLYVGLLFGIGGALAVTWLVPQSRSGARVVLAAIVIGAAGTAMSPGLQGLDALGATISRFFEPLIWTTGMDTSYGRTVIVLLAAFACALLALSTRSRVVSLLCLLEGAAALALSGHASAAEPQWLMRPTVFAHAAAITFWIGALLPLGLALRSTSVDATYALRRFSRIIPYAVAILIASGFTLVAIQVRQPQALAETAYGRLLLAKLGLLLVLFALAAFNRWKLTQPAENNEPAARRGLARAIAAETVLVIAILAIVAGWRFTPPPRAIAITAAQPAETHIHTSRAMADLTITPGRAGPVSVSAILMTGEFGPLHAKEVTFVFSNPGAGIEPFRRKAEKPGDGTWRAGEVILPLPGKWTVRIDILITDFEIARIQGELEIRP